MASEISYEESCMKARIKIRNEYGIHARPSALITRCATRYEDKTILLFNLDNGTGPIDCKNIMQVMTVEAPRGSTVEVRVSARDDKDETARDACRELSDLIFGGFGEEIIE